jgi:Vitamin B12 dependent methionine synthase, activation domain
MAEAFAEYAHRRIRGELGFAADEARDPEAMLAQGYRGSRYSFGYPACPNLADQKQLLALLNAAAIGITPVVRALRALRGKAPLRGRPARPRAIDFGDRRPPPADRVFLSVTFPCRQRNFLSCATQFVPPAGLTRGSTSSHRRDKTWMRGSGPRKGAGVI